MLRRRLLSVIGPMVALLAITAVLGVVLLQETLAQLVQANDSDLAIVNQANDFLGYFRDARRNLHEMAIGHPNQLEQMSDSIVRASALLADIDNSPIVHHSVFNPTLGRIRAGFPKLKTDLAALATPAADLSVTHIESLISAMNVIDPDVGSLSGLVKDQAARDYQELSSRFRWQVLAFSVVSILVINLSVIALLRMGSMILRPVDMLVAAAREMGQENFSVRIEARQQRRVRPARPLLQSHGRATPGIRETPHRSPRTGRTLHESRTEQPHQYHRISSARWSARVPILPRPSADISNKSAKASPE